MTATTERILEFALAVVVSLCGLLLFSPANAQSGKLASFQSLDSTTKVSGEIISFDGRTFHVRTPLGDLMLEASQVTCTGDPCPDAQQVTAGYRISGPADILGQLIDELIANYGFDSGADVTRTADELGRVQFELSTDVAGAPRTITLIPDATGSAFKSMLDGTADFVISDRGPDPQEISLLKLGGQGDVSSEESAMVLALEPVEVIVAVANRTRTVSEDDLGRILSGRVSKWSELGGPDDAINVYLSSADNSTTAILEAQILKPSRLSLSDRITFLGSADEVADVVARDINGIGIVGASHRRNARTLPIVGSCGLAMSSDSFSVKSGEYPFVRAIQAFKPATLSSVGANDLWRYLQSENAGEEILRAGYADLGLELKQIDSMGRRLAAAIAEPQAEVTLQGLQAMMSVLNGAERLSTTFRFRSGSIELDGTGRRDLGRLVRNLSGPELSGRRIIVAGFTDSVGVAERNLATSTARAELVRDFLLDLAPDGFGPTDITAFGFGELAPIACNDTDTGRQVNQRVEIWVR